MPSRTLQLRNFTPILDDLHMRFQLLAENTLAVQGITIAERNDLLEDIRATRRTILKRCQSRACQPADLNDSGYRGYLWLVFLSESRRFDQHLKFIIRFLQEWKKRTNKTVTVRMYNSPFVFQCKPEKNQTKVTIGEGFLTSDDQAIQILVDCCLQSTRRSLAHIRKVSRSSTYKQVMDAIWQHGGQSTRSTKGDHYDLQQLFDRLNAEYFQGKLEQPRLCWSSRRATRRLGYYHPDTDTITVSRYLDQSAIPLYVVEYVLYHEMLHKKLGLKEVNSYRLAHTTQFKQQERKFKFYDEAEKFFKTFSRT
ncbi:MAG TPA: hypothetical protein PLL88_08345 [Anaerolineaceae bacterium]|nr:hypothetical protein [Anaerolineaceae bacterium]